MNHETEFSLEKYLNTLAHIQHFPEEQHTELCQRLGFGFEHWLELKKQAEEHFYELMLARQIDTLKTFGLRLTERKIALQKQKLQLEQVQEFQEPPPPEPTPEPTAEPGMQTSEFPRFSTNVGPDLRRSWDSVPPAFPFAGTASPLGYNFQGTNYNTSNDFGTYTAPQPSFPQEEGYSYPTAHEQQHTWQEAARKNESVAPVALSMRFGAVPFSEKPPATIRLPFKTDAPPGTDHYPAQTQRLPPMAPASMRFPNQPTPLPPGLWQGEHPSPTFQPLAPPPVPGPPPSFTDFAKRQKAAQAQAMQPASIPLPVASWEDPPDDYHNPPETVQVTEFIQLSDIHAQAPEPAANQAPLPTTSTPKLTLHQYAALQADLDLAPASEHPEIIAKFNLDQTSYLQECDLWDTRLTTDKKLFEDYSDLFAYMRSIKE
jgi:hypothetical protein